MKFLRAQSFVSVFERPKNQKNKNVPLVKKVVNFFTAKKKISVKLLLYKLNFVGLNFKKFWNANKNVDPHVFAFTHTIIELIYKMKSFITNIISDNYRQLLKFKVLKEYHYSIS